MGRKGPARSNYVSNPTPATRLHQGRNEIALLFVDTAAAVDWREQHSTKVTEGWQRSYDCVLLNGIPSVLRPSCESEENLPKAVRQSAAFERNQGIETVRQIEVRPG
jgi:hypothetical protein